jgi:hypothetical protein
VSADDRPSPCSAVFAYSPLFLWGILHGFNHTEGAALVAISLLSVSSSYRWLFVGLEHQNADAVDLRI